MRFILDPIVSDTGHSLLAHGVSRIMASMAGCIISTDKLGFGGAYASSNLGPASPCSQIMIKKASGKPFPKGLFSSKLLSERRLTLLDAASRIWCHLGMVTLKTGALVG
jgi:hypothetical protein